MYAFALIAAGVLLAVVPRESDNAVSDGAGRMPR